MDSIACAHIAYIHARVVLFPTLRKARKKKKTPSLKPITFALARPLLLLCPFAHSHMLPYVARARTLTNAPYLAIAVPFYSVQKSELLSCMFFKVVHKGLADGGSGLSGRPLIYTCKRVI